MRRIDQPLEFEQPLALKNSLLEIQQHYQQIVQHIDYFDNQLVQKRQQIADYFCNLARQRTEDAVRRARGQEKPRFSWRPFMSRSDESAQELPAKRRRNAPYRFNIASTKGAFYQH